MFRSLKGRIVVLFLLLIAAASAAGILMIGLFRQSTAAQLGRAAAEIARDCDVIAGAYRFFTAGRHDPAPVLDGDLRRQLSSMVQTALRNQSGVEGGIWQANAGSLAYAFPTYEGAGPKTDLPEAERPRIREINRAALAEDRPIANRYDAATQSLLMTACPLPGPIPDATAWTMIRVPTFAGRAYEQVAAGLVILFVTVIAAAILLGHLASTWWRHVSRIEAALKTHDIAELPSLALTGERELDRIVTALNEAGRSLAEARRRADRLAGQVALAERLAAIGRVAAGVAHEIRNPIAAMRLKAENALAGSPERNSEALPVILAQIQRIDTLLRRLLSVTERNEPHRERVALRPFLDLCAADYVDIARERDVKLCCSAEVESACFDPGQMRSALGNLILNAIQAAPTGTEVRIAARRDADTLVLSIEDEGAGPPEGIRNRLFEPFVTGRPDGTGLGLPIVREIAEAHGGTVQFAVSAAGTLFRIILPWQPS
jgi:signal transduction histidine kinase